MPLWVDGDGQETFAKKHVWLCVKWFLHQLGCGCWCGMQWERDAGVGVGCGWSGMQVLVWDVVGAGCRRWCGMW